MAAPLVQYSTRSIQDALLQATANFANGGSSASTNAIDLGCAAPWPSTERVTIQVATAAAVANTGNAGNINISFQHSAVNLAANFVNIPQLAPALLTTTTNSFVASTTNVQLPPSVLQFVRCLATTDAGNPSTNTGTFAIKALF